MKINVNVKVGKGSMTVQVEDVKEKEALNKAITLCYPPEYCHVCQNSDPMKFKLDSNKDKEGNVYINTVCLKDSCFAKAKLGEYKTGGYFWHKFEKYVKPNQDQSGSQQQTQQNYHDDGPPQGFPQGGGQEDDLPF